MRASRGRSHAPRISRAITQPWFPHGTLLNLLGPPDEPLDKPLEVSILHLTILLLSSALTILRRKLTPAMLSTKQ